VTDGELHEVSQSIGRLQGEVGDMRTEQIRMRETLHELSNKIHLLLIMHDKFQDMEPVVEDYKQVKQRLLGAMAVIGTLFGLLGSWLHTLLTR
jgi:hypothetical protein